MGNLRSVEKALEKAGAETFVSQERNNLEQADLLVVPGVGAFDAALKVLRAAKLDGFIKEWIAAEKPYLGICLGLQLLFESSGESPGARGLGVLPGTVVRFRPGDRRLKVPHMGWNEVRPAGAAGPFGKGVLPAPEYFYFVHSFYPRPEDPALVWAETTYGEKFCSAVARKNLAATQFHPEKSGETGLRFLKALLSRFTKERDR
jgi:imidazole glycerol phosphate synthase glutamine amidotransferase subunit